MSTRLPAGSASMPRSTSRPTTVPGSNDSCAGHSPKVGGTRPPFALERIEATSYGATGGERIVYRPPPSRTGRRHRSLAHPPRVHRGARSAHSSATHSSPPLSRGAGSRGTHRRWVQSSGIRSSPFGREQGGIEESTSEQLGRLSVAGSFPGRRTSSRWAALRASMRSSRSSARGTARSVVAGDP